MKKVYLYESTTKKPGSKKSVLTDIYALVDDEDFEKVNKHKWYLMKLYHCNTDILYARRYEGLTRLGTYKAVLMHRFVMNECDRKVKIDHFDFNGLNNQKINLRKCTHQENLLRSRIKTESKTGYIGVYERKRGTYTVMLTVNDHIYRGSNIDNKDRAAMIYNVLKRIHCGENVVLNKIPTDASR